MNINDLQDIEAEKATLRLLINNIDLMASVNDKLEAKDFYGLANQTIFAALREMFDDGTNVDLVTLADHLTSNGKMDNVGGITYITDIYNGIINKGGLDNYINIIKEYSRRRYFAKCCDAATRRVHDKTITVSEMAGKMADVLEKIQPVEQIDQKGPLIEAFSFFVQNKPQGIDTGFKEIDYTLKGMKKGNLIVLAARPAMGKTTLALNIIANLCREGKKVVLYSLEMTAQEIYTKLISCVSKVSLNSALQQRTKDNQTKNNLFETDVKNARDNESKAFWTRLEKGLNVVDSWNLNIIDHGSYDISDLRIASKVWKKKSGLDLLVIDYLQLMSAKGNDNRTAEVSAITKGLKNLAKELEIPILALAQLNRRVEGSQNKKPSMSDLRESGSIEQDADAVLLIYRDQYYNKQGDPWTEVIIDKNRGGETSTARLQFYPEISKFYDYNGIGGKTVSNNIVKGVF